MLLHRKDEMEKLGIEIISSSWIHSKEVRFINQLK